MTTNKTSRADYAKRLKLARKRREWTQEECAYALGVHVNTVRNAERMGRAAPATKDRAFAVLGVKR